MYIQISLSNKQKPALVSALLPPDSPSQPPLANLLTASRKTLRIVRVQRRASRTHAARRTSISTTATLPIDTLPRARRRSRRGHHSGRRRRGRRCC